MTPHMLTSLLLSLSFFCLTGCSSADPSCEAVIGTVTGQSVPVFEADQVVGFRVEGATVAGDMTGTSSADFSIMSVDDDGTLHLTGSHTFWDPAGAFLFRTEDQGLTTADGQIENAMTIVEGGTGSLNTEGTVDLATGALTLSYTGQVCR